jgi:hypothetical protein
MVEKNISFLKHLSKYVPLGRLFMETLSLREVKDRMADSSQK